jgi:hypothetical protein
MALHGGDRNLRQHEGGAPELCRVSTTEGLPCEALKTGLETMRLISRAAFQGCRPISLDKVVAAEEQQQAGIVQMQACPRRRVERGGKSIASVDGCCETPLIGKHRSQPPLAGALGVTLRSGARVQLDLILLPHDSREMDRSTSRFHRSGCRLYSAHMKEAGDARPPVWRSFCGLGLDHVFYRATDGKPRQRV